MSPDTSTSVSADETNIKPLDDDDEVLRVLSALDGNNGDDDKGPLYANEEQVDPAKQLQQPLNDKFTASNSILRKGIRGDVTSKKETTSISGTMNETETGPAPLRAVTVAEALAQLTAKKGAEIKRLSNAMANAPDLDDFSDGMDVGNGVFVTNDRLRAMADSMPTSSATGALHYTADEVRRLVKARDYEDEDDARSYLALLNPSQLAALQDAITKPISLIQGPPGTGKTRTACTILSTVVELKNQRMLIGGEKAKGQKFHKVLACAHSNTATDNLLAGLLAQGVKVVRIGKNSTFAVCVTMNLLANKLYCCCIRPPRQCSI
jgi:hypothetical protein